MNKLLMVLLLLSSLNTMAKAQGNESGSGGDGVVLGDRVYLFDLYEAGIQDINLSEEVSKRVDVTSKVNKSLSSFSPNVRSIVANKIVALREIDIAFSEILLQGFNMFSWRIIPFTLLDVADDDGTDIEFPINDLVQIAVRSNRVIRIDKALMSKMDDGQVAALIFHEIIYAFITPSRVVGRINKTTFKQSSRWVRDINSYLFSNEFRVNPKTLINIIGKHLPLSSVLNLNQAMSILYHDVGFDIEPSVFLDTGDYSPNHKINYDIWSAKNGELEKILNRACKGREATDMDFYSQKVTINFNNLNDINSSEKTYLYASVDFDSYNKYGLRFNQDSYNGGDLRANHKACVQGISAQLDTFFQRYSIIK